MGKIWLKSVDPNKQCCGCEGKTGPCDSCCDQIQVDISQSTTHLSSPFNFYLPTSQINTNECQILSTIWDKINRISKSEIQVISNPSDSIIPNGFFRQLAFNISLTTGETLTINGLIGASQDSPPTIDTNYGVSLNLNAGSQYLSFQPLNGNLAYQFSYVTTSLDRFPSSQNNGVKNGSIVSGTSSYFPNFGYSQVLLPPIIPAPPLILPVGTKTSVEPVLSPCYGVNQTAPATTFDENTASIQENANVRISSKDIVFSIKAHTEVLSQPGLEPIIYISKPGTLSQALLCSEVLEYADIVYFSTLGIQPPTLPGGYPSDIGPESDNSAGLPVVSEGDVTFVINKYSLNFNVDIRSNRNTQFTDTFSITISPKQPGCYQLILPAGIFNQVKTTNGIVISDFFQTMTYDIKSTSNLKITNLQYIKNNKNINCPVTGLVTS